MVPGTVGVDDAGGIVRVTLRRPPLNLFEPHLIAALRDAFTRVATDRDARVIVLAGAARAFSGGMDVQVLRTLDVATAKTLITTLHEAIAAVHDAPVPVVGRLHGAALGAGFELALACDLRIAAAGTLLGLPEVKVGLPSVIEAALLPPAIGPARAAELLFTGDHVTAEQALTWGLVNQAVSSGDLDAAVDRMAWRIVDAAPGAVRLQKELVVRWRQTDLRTAVGYGINAFATAYAGDEPREGADAFLGKRKAAWRRDV